MPNEKIEYFTFSTKAGWLGISGSREGLLAATLPHNTSLEALKALNIDPNKAIWSPLHFSDISKRLKRYFDGHKEVFSDKVNMAAASGFQKLVWQAVRQIPYGQTMSYGQLAAQIGRPKAARAVGKTLGDNPLPVIIPCHRVINASGSQGGYSGGAEIKRYLLKLEGNQKIKS